MSEQALDFRRSARIIRRYLALVGAIALLGLLAGAGYSVYKPPLQAANALVVVPSAVGFPAANSAYINTQLVIAYSDPVLSGALPYVGADISLATLRDRVRVAGLTSNVVSITAEGRTAAQAVATVNAVANSYVAYVGSGSSPVGRVKLKILGKATIAAGARLPVRLAESAGIGLLIGALVGAIVVLAIGRGDRRLRERDQIADSIGVPVLASVPAERPRDAAGWAELLEHYEPRAIDAWHLRKALQDLGFVGTNSGRAGSPNGSGATSPPSLAVLSLSSDRKALALGPQLAAFAASMGVRTALVLGPQQDDNAVATLYAAGAAAPLLRSGNLIVAAGHRYNTDWPAGTALVVVVGVVDGENPRVADTVPANTTVLGVSAGAATAEQLARIATSAAIDGRDVSGVIVADPDPADQTTGRIPQLDRAGERRMPTRIARAATETRR
jgi:capsular polysaccharide biosynthesis protein